MKKIYALVLGLLAFAWLAVVPAAHAQYTITSYDITTNHNAWSSIAGQGSDISEITAANQYEYYKVSNEITLPFNFRFVNTVTNKVKVEQDGDIIVGGSAQWPDGQTYDYGSYYGCGFTQNQFGYPQYGYGYYSNNTIRPYAGYHYNAGGKSTYAIFGTSPNRTVTFETQNWQNVYFTNTCNYQAVLYEVAANGATVSRIDFNYGPASSPGTVNYNYGETIGIGLKVNATCGNYVSIACNTDPGNGNAPINTTCGCYDNENYKFPTWNYSFQIRYDYNLSWSNPSTYPANGQILLINNAITPTAKIANEGRFAMTAVNLRLVITGDPTNPYDNNVNLTAAQIPLPRGGNSPSITFPNYTPVNYGLYTMTWTVNTSTPADQFPSDNILKTQFIISPPNNVAAIKPLIPVLGSRTPLAIPTPVSFEFRNLGVNDQTGVPVSIYITNPQGVVVYRDTQILNNWLSSQIRDTNFKDFTPTQNGAYTMCGFTLLGSDQNHLDDTVCNSFLVRYEADVAALSILNPDDQEEKPEKVRFKPVAYFQSVGVTDLFDVPVQLQIRRCSDNTLVFKADTIMPELNVDAGAVKMSFPSYVPNTTNDIGTLAPGCYQMCAIARQANDGDRTNDTACTYFSIIPRLKGDINVGIGQRFQTISAAVDSCRFRGIGGNLNLILTDANYTENGNTTVSTPTTAVDFTGINGTGPNAVVTWKPKKGVNPTITFTGTKQYCFSWSYKSCPYMVWDGNSQLAPTPDLLSAEPVKRGITVINQSTTPGSIINIAYGRHDLTFKNMTLRNNANLSAVSSQVIHMENIYTFTSFLQGIMDTATNNHITIDNNEIGNANVGISDIGTIPLFDINQAVFFDKRNNNNRITRNTIGSQAFPIGGIGANIGNEDGLYLGHNEVSWVTGYNASTYGGGISVANGNSINLWIDANKIHALRALPPTASTLVGIDIQQAATIYTQGSGSGQKLSTLPVSTRNRITNNMIYDMRLNPSNNTTIQPMSISTSAATYFVDNDSVFNNSFAVGNAPSMISMTRVGRPFLWNNILQDLNTNVNVNAVVYNLTVPRPMVANINSDYNDFDFRNASLFATVSEYDRATGTFIQTRNFKSLNDWRTYTQQDIHSVTGDPMFGADSLHMPNATSYILSPASNNGAWLGTGTQTLDFDGEARLVANNTPDIGADEFEGFQYVNDLAVQVITRPGGLTDNAGVVNVTAENPLAIQAIVKNQGGIQVFNRNVYSRLDVSTDNGATWNLYQPPLNGGSATSVQQVSFAVAETKTLDFVGPTIVNEAGKLFRVTVSVDPDQNNANNSISKTFKLLVKRAAVVLSYYNDGVGSPGNKNKDSVAAALQRLGVPYDSIDRVAFGTNDIDYTPWWTVVWSMGNQATAYNGPLGVGAISLKEENEIIRYLGAGQTWAKKSLVIAGENIAQYNDPTSAFRQLNNVITDQELMANWLHTQYVARYPGLNYPAALPTAYRGLINGVGNYFKFSDSLFATSPDVIKVNPVTGGVGENISRVGYTYAIHPSTPLDSGAATAWTGSTYNVVFYAFDWADGLQSVNFRDGEVLPVNVSGSTRLLRGALDFIQSFRGTVLPVEFTDVKGSALKTGNQITWSVATQKSVDHYEVEMLDGSNWNWVGEAKASSATNYSLMHTAPAAFEVGKSFTYRVVSVDLDGSRSASKSVSFGRTGEGVEFSLEQNFPNPFSGSTVFGFTLPENGTVSIRILDMTGKTVATPVNSVDYATGKNSFNMNVTNLASGTYVYELSFVNANGEVSKLSRKMTLSK